MPNPAKKQKVISELALETDTWCLVDSIEPDAGGGGGGAGVNKLLLWRIEWLWPTPLTQSTKVSMQQNLTVCVLKAARLFIVNVEFLFSTTNTTAVAFIVVLLQCTALTCANCSIAAV